ncbi:MAG TPA: thioredoxin domain-containing protein [Flavisolibacter sp.]|jgi:protein-disulfide isomerase|nr:thioredoxin domain-containing protein [Flavisolibacter sp.]
MNAAKKDIVPVIPSKEIIVGDKTAKVKLVMFGDYESDETGQATEVIKQLLEEYAGKINFVFRHFPLTKVHQKAHKAAEAAIGAGQEDKFWEMHQLLFAHRRNLGVISLKSYAREVGVKDKRFLDHLINSDWGVHVQDDLKEGIELGIKEIPVLFVNGEWFEKDITVKNVKASIDTLLKSDASSVIKLKSKKRA